MRNILIGLVVVVALLAGGFMLIQRKPATNAELDPVYTSVASKFIDMGDGVSAHYRDEGNKNGRPLLLVHGFSSSLHTWEKWVPLLGNEYRLISVDLPGHGLTHTPAGYGPSIENYADFVEAFATKLNLGKVTVIGSSMGGNTAWQLALRHPGRVDGLVLVGASGWPDPRIDDAEEPAIFKMLRNPVMGPILRRIDNSAQVRTGLKAAFVNQALVDDAMVKRYVDFSRLPNHGETLIAIMTGDRTLATKEMLAKITAPTLILHGRQDHLVAVDGGTKFNDAITGSKLVIYEDVGHLPQEEIPERSAEDLRAFLHAAFPEPVAGVALSASMP